MDGKLIYFNPYTGRYINEFLRNTIWQGSVIIEFFSHETVCKSFCWSVDTIIVVTVVFLIMGKDTSLNNGNCEEQLLKPIAGQLAADRLPAGYQQTTGQLPTNSGRYY